MELTKVKYMVESVLAEDIQARNNDLWLILQIWQKKQQVKCFIPYTELKKMITPESITRCRRKLNEDHRYLPTDPKVIRRRRLREREIRRWAIK